MGKNDDSEERRRRAGRRPSGAEPCSRPPGTGRQQAEPPLALGATSAAYPRLPCTPGSAFFSLGEGLIKKDEKEGNTLPGDLREK